jgi:uncharacterized protein (TIGR03435 family)
MRLFVKTALFLVMLAGALRAQQRTAFEVATVKLSPATPPGAPISISLGSVRNGTVILTNTTLSECLQFAYGIVSADQVVGPDWIRSREVRFDIVAKIDPNTPQDEVLVMMQNLLAERLKVALHRDKKQLPFLALVTARNGPKLQPAKEGVINPGPQGAGRINHPRMPMSLLATLLSRFERQIVIDLTGLSGPFAIDLQWTTDALRARAPQDGAPLVINGQTVDVNGPSLYTALPEQLGLRLESRKGPVDVLVVDHADQVPTEN